jgi:hypothetical protein
VARAGVGEYQLFFHRALSNIGENELAEILRQKNTGHDHGAGGDFRVLQAASGEPGKNAAPIFGLDSRSFHRPGHPGKHS